MYLTVTCIDVTWQLSWHKECQVMCGPPTLRDTFQVSHLWHVTLLSWPIRGQDRVTWPGVSQSEVSVTWCQGDLEPVHYQGSQVFDLWSVRTMILCVNQGSGDSANSPWGTKDLQLDLYRVILKLVQPKIWSIFSPQLLLYSSPLNIILHIFSACIYSYKCWIWFILTFCQDLVFLKM